MVLSSHRGKQTFITTKRKLEMNRHHELYNSWLHSNTHRAVSSPEQNGKSREKRYFETYSLLTLHVTLLLFVTYHKHIYFYEKFAVMRRW